MCSSNKFSKEFEDEYLNMERERLDTHNRDVISVMQDRANNERFRNNMEIITKDQKNIYENMFNIVRLQTYLMVLQSVIFACILFSI